MEKFKKVWKKFEKSLENIIFGILAPSAFRKYSICLVFSELWPCLCPCICLCLCLCLCIEVNIVMSKGHLSQPINIHRGNLNLNTFTHSSWNFFCLCHCLCHCNCLCPCIWIHCMIEDIVLFTSIFHFSSLAGSLDDSKGFGSDLDFSCRRTDGLTDGLTD